MASFVGDEREASSFDFLCVLYERININNIC